MAGQVHLVLYPFVCSIGLSCIHNLLVLLLLLRLLLQCCGGQGFLSANKIGTMANDMNVDVTFEGDNTVMMQQVGAGSAH